VKSNSKESGDAGVKGRLHGGLSNYCELNANAYIRI